MSVEEGSGDNYNEFKHLTVAYYASYRTMVNFYSEFIPTDCFKMLNLS